MELIVSLFWWFLLIKFVIIPFFNWVYGIGQPRPRPKPIADVSAKKRLSESHLSPEKVVVFVESEEKIFQLYAAELSDYFGDKLKLIHFSRVTWALDFLSVNKPDMIISCILLPDMSGIDFLHKCKELYPEVPFIFNTAYDFRDDFRVWKCDAYVVKSSDVSSLNATIKQLLRSRRKFYM